jgi:LPXTG-site transpeptidase (sortase) family protein
MLKIIKRYKLLYILGVILVGTSIGWNLNQTIQNIQLSYFTPKVTPIKNIYSIPTEINIDKVNLHLPVEETAIYNGIWQIAQNGASHLAISARPGEKGPIIFYAHNTNDKFGPIRWLSKGDIIQIKTSDGKNHNYIVSQTLEAQPDELNIFTNIKEEGLVLYTCDGFADLKRFVLIGKPN